MYNVNMCKTQEGKVEDFLADVATLSATWTFMENAWYLKKMAEDNNGVSAKLMMKVQKSILMENGLISPKTIEKLHLL